MKTLIVDDEAFVRMSLKTSIDWEGHAFELAGEASNGEDALAKIAELQPDIVFLDIKMPIMDGLEVMKRLREGKEMPKIVILSSFNEFDYVREAMRLGAFDYIHKPSQSAACLLETMLRAREAILRERKRTHEMESLKHNVERIKPNMKALFFKEWAAGAVRHAWEVEEKTRLYDIGLKQPNVCCMAMTVDQFAKVKKRYKKNMEYLLGFSIQNILNEIFRKYEEIEFYQADDKRFVILKSYSKLRSSQEIYGEQWELIKSVQTALKQFLNVTVSFGVSAPHGSLLDIPAACKESSQAAAANFYEGAAGVSFFQNLATEAVNDAPTQIETDMVRLMKQDIAEERWDGLRASLERLHQRIREKRELSRTDTIRTAIHLHYSLHEVYTTGAVSESPEFPEIEQFTEADTLRQIFDLLQREAELVQNRKCAAAQSGNYKVRMVLEYIHRHYNEELTLEELSHYVDLNSSYLSRLFKEQTGMMLIQYINQYRVNKSLELLRNSTLKTYEIAEKVGFTSTDNFYIAFKKIYGHPPNEFRKHTL
ncbi:MULTISPECIES: response regulator [unclassified Paenibacillus]|uniref:response regulator transcription factor n=1 Tax=unclassified Paenibacillus TaxID=185978 RepID=UPI001C0F6F08|nr:MULTISPECIES: response regulator [unclassified Paenibacillus]MBU5444763.1 response regulator [Paenibacillus sp. MSJ-34]CAH0119338.1 Protein-glutamate methylesterase/protein-glutamine glutaminase [Paenibacillus sp. CECT 9249]